MGMSTVPKYTVLDWKLEFKDFTIPTVMSPYQFPERCREPENMIEPGKKIFPGALLTPRKIRTSNFCLPYNME